MTTVTDRPPARRRGRPYRYPEDASPLANVHGGVDKRTAWLLGSSRVHALNAAMASREQFLPLLKELGVTADQARVSRWESGSQKVPDKVVAVYEQVLGLAPGHLVAAIDGLRCSLEPWTVSKDLATASPLHLHERLDHLFEKVDGDDPHGSHWLELTDYLATHPQIYLRQASWTQLAESLMSELGRSAGAAYTRRFEALRTLVRHPGAQRHVVKSIGAFVTDPAAPVVVHPLTLLQEVGRPQAGELVLRMLSNGTGMLQQGAAWATATKISRGHYDEPTLRQIEAVVVMLLADKPRALPEAAVLDVAARLPRQATHRVLHALRDSPAQGRFEGLLRTGEILPQEITRQLARRVAESAQAATPAPYRIEPDLMLRRLVREALFHGHLERRHQAAVLLAVSPYRTGVAAACAEVVAEEELTVAVQAVALLRYLATEREREMLLDWALDPGRPQVRGHALIALGNLPRGVRPEDEPVVLAGLDETSERPTQRASLYVLGMGGAAALDGLTRDDDQFVSQVARWWARTGPAIHEAERTSGQIRPSSLGSGT